MNHCIAAKQQSLQNGKMKTEYWLRLANASHLSPLIYTRLLAHFGGAQQVCQADAKNLAALGVKAQAIQQLHQPDKAALANQHRWGEQPQQTLLTVEDPRYPRLLKTIADPPPVLFVRGNVEVLSRFQVAVVGSRNPSPGGAKAAHEFAHTLAQAGLAITSGLAVGIDGCAHRGALAIGGMTIAVLGSGLERLYPAEHRPLADEIVAAGGALVTEFPPSAAPMAAHFPRRNRLISGLSLGVCVIEAALRSGSLITARFAVEQGREVYAVPGSIYNPLTQGCHALIQQGAKLAATPADILGELQQETTQWTILPTRVPVDSDCRQLLECVGFEATSVDQVVQKSGRIVSQVLELLVKLELKGYIKAVIGGYVRLGLVNAKERDDVIATNDPGSH
jgi:DNA processing protein